VVAKTDFGRGSALDPAGRAYDAPHIIRRLERGTLLPHPLPLDPCAFGASISTPKACACTCARRYRTSYTSNYYLPRFHLSKINILKYWKQYWKSSCRSFHTGLYRL